MTTFFSLLKESDKASTLLASVSLFRDGKRSHNTFSVEPVEFSRIPGAPFAYWVSDSVRRLFESLSALEGNGTTAKQGLSTADDKRFVRAAWEVDSGGRREKWPLFAKGGTYSPYYSDIHLVVNWWKNGAEIKEGICARYPYLNHNWEFVAKNTEYYLRPGLTWPRRTQIGLGMRLMPAGCIFADKGPAVFVDGNTHDSLLGLLAITTSSPFKGLVELQMAFGSYEVGVIQKTPLPRIPPQTASRLSFLAKLAWASTKTLDSTEETSHAFVLPEAIRARLGDYEPASIEAEILRVKAEIDDIAFDLYGFSEEDRAALLQPAGAETANSSEDDAEEDDGDTTLPVDSLSALLSWAIGVAFGRFDRSLATGERKVPPDPSPFDSLPAKSPGMLPDGAVPFHENSGILVEDQGSPHDLAHLIEEVLTSVDFEVPEDIRRWLQRDFFAFHLQRYSKSRRKAPIYWPLSSPSGSYTLWVYYPTLTDQTLYTAINNFVEPKLKQVESDVAVLRNRGTMRSRDDERQFDSLQAFEVELIELRDTLLRMAPTYKPNHDDGVQISGAPLWPLFRHKSWQKVLKDTWTKLENGDYDWAYIAMNYWPDRVREKCKTDKSLAIAHGLEDRYVEPEAKPKKARGKKKRAGDDE